MSKTIRCFNVYKQGHYERSEKICSFKEYVEMGRLAPGQIILIAELDADGTSSNANTFVVGDCTPNVLPGYDDNKAKWDLNDPMMKKYVLEVNIVR